MKHIIYYRFQLSIIIPTISLSQTPYLCKRISLQNDGVNPELIRVLLVHLEFPPSNLLTSDPYVFLGTTIEKQQYVKKNIFYPFHLFPLVIFFLIFLDAFSSMQKKAYVFSQEKFI